MNFVNEKNGIRVIFHFFHHCFQPFFKITAIAGACQQRAHVQRIYRGFRQDFGRFALNNLARQTFGDGGFANARIAHQQGVIFAAAAQNLNATFHFRLAANQRVNIALSRLNVQINAVFRQGRFLRLARFGLWCFGFILGPNNGARLAKGWVFGHAMRDEIHRIIARHILFLQEIGGVAFAFGENGNQNIGARHFGPARRLHMNSRALDHALEGGGWYGL